MKKRTALAISLTLLIAGTSCSRQSKIRRAVSKSRQHYTLSAQSLKNDDVEKARSHAEKAVAYALQAQQYEPVGMLADLTESRLAEGELLAGAFQSPEGALQCWWDSVGRGDVTLGMALFDADRSCALICDPVGDPEGYEEISAVFAEAMAKMYEKRAGLVHSIELRVVETWRVDGEARVGCQIYMNDMMVKEASFTCYMYEDLGLWRGYDLTAGVKREDALSVIEAIRLHKEATSLDQLLEVFRGKEGIEAFQGIRAMGEAIPHFARERPWSHGNVRTLESVVLHHQGEERVIEPGAILKVLEHVKTTTDEYLMVSTPEADPDARATGRIPKSECKYIGTDEAELWGLDVGN